MYVGLASFVTMCALYLSSLPKLHHINEVAAGLKAPYASMEEGVVALLKGRLMIEIFFWSTLWAVKLSLLCMFQQLTIGLPTYTKIWWGVMAFTILAFIGCVVSAFTSCSSMHAWFSPDGESPFAARPTLSRHPLIPTDECSTPRDSVARFASLWYSFVADLLTDLTSNIPFCPSN
jgi:hypothetical protein